MYLPAEEVRGHLHRYYHSKSNLNSIKNLAMIESSGNAARKSSSEELSYCLFMAEKDLRVRNTAAANIPFSMYILRA
jgi:hypothetical protein